MAYLKQIKNRLMWKFASSVNDCENLSAFSFFTWTVSCFSDPLLFSAVFLVKKPHGQVGFEFFLSRQSLVKIWIMILSYKILQVIARKNS